MIIRFYRNLSDNNDINKDLQSITTIEGTLKENCNIMNPSITVKISSGIMNANYMYIEEFNRYYYITSMEIINNGMMIINAHVDVLYTYKDSILSNQMIIARQENDVDLDLPDPEMITKAYQNVQYVKFPGKFNNFSIIMPIVGA